MTETAYLSLLGERVRALAQRARRDAQGGSPWRAECRSATWRSSRRGEGNISVLLLRKVARAMGVPVENLVREVAPREKPIALLGLRGAGKSTLGAKLAEAAQRTAVHRFDREVEKEAGAELGEVFALYGQDAYRRFERRALEHCVGA